VSIRDNGPGIPEDEISVALDNFGQGSNAIKSAEQGAGLGLPIVRSLIHLHGGTFTLKSKLREGTEVIVTFPPERIMSALERIDQPPPTQPAQEAPPEPPRPPELSRFRRPGWLKIGA
jgi:two-component system cell cycle sensor histidine kinase PleC